MGEGVSFCGGRRINLWGDGANLGGGRADTNLWWKGRKSMGQGVLICGGQGYQSMGEGYYSMGRSTNL